MPPDKANETSAKDLIVICGKLIEVFVTQAAQTADVIHILREQNDILRKSNERMETFLFVGDPIKDIPPFVTWTRDGVGDVKGTIKRWQDNMNWAIKAVVAVFITAGVGAVIYMRFPPVP